jgi:hypothetical protein
MDGVETGSKTKLRNTRKETQMRTNKETEEDEHIQGEREMRAKKLLAKALENICVLRVLSEV